MFILEEPYVSDFLATTVAELGLPVLDTPMARRRLSGSLAMPLSGDDAFAAAASRQGARLYSNSENAIGWIAEHLGRSDLPRQIELFKDKVAFRDLVADLYPDYRYFGLPLSGLRAFDPSRLRAPFVVKPTVGFFSLGVHVVKSAMAWPAAQDDIAKLIWDPRRKAFGHDVRDLLPGEVDHGGSLSNRICLKRDGTQCVIGGAVAPSPVYPEAPARTRRRRRHSPSA